MFKFNFGKKKNDKPKTLKEMFFQNLITEEELLRFTITQKEMDLENSKEELKKFLGKRVKKIRKVKK